MTIESGKQYSIAEIFSGDKRIIIPDLQRDYCWGNRKDLAKNFLQSLIDLFEDSSGLYKQVSLGLIYAYENPRNFVNIADGQQRITTIYLLLCVIYKRITESEDSSEIKNELKNFLTLGSGKNVWEPRLRYEVRESTVYFIKAFLNNEINKNTNKDLNRETIENASWFRDDFKTDPSIMSMLDTIYSFYQKLIAEQEQHEKFKLNNFAYFILGITPKTIKEESMKFIGDGDESIRGKIPKDSNSISRLYQGHSGICFVYFNVENRDFGEKLYVIINTRGAPMEPNEHLKPLLISKLDKECKKNENNNACNCQNCWTEKWEKWQDFFWQNRIKDEESGDNGFNDFLDWYRQIKLKVQRNWKSKASEKNITDDFSIFLNKKNALNILDETNSYYKALKSLVGYLTNNEYKSILKQMNCEIFVNKEGKPKTQLRNLNVNQQQTILLPMLSFMVKISNDKDQCYLFLRRLRKNYFDLIRNERRKNYIDWRYILQIIENSNNLSEVLRYDKELEQITNLKLPEGLWYNEEEQIKDNIFPNRNTPLLLDDFVNSIFEWEDHNDFAGDISPLIKLCNCECNVNSELSTTNVTKENLEKYFNIYNKTTESEKTENIKIFNLFSFLALPFRYNNTENSEWWINGQNIKYFHEIENFYPIWVKIKKETFNEQGIIKLLTQIIYSKIVNTDDENFDYLFSITENDFNISNYNDLNIHNNTKLYYLLLFLNTIDLININKIFNYTDHINFRAIDNNENNLILGNWIIWSRSRRGHYWGNIPLYNCWQVKDRMDNFLYFKKMIPKNEEEIEIKIEKNTKNHIESLNNFFRKLV